MSRYYCYTWLILPTKYFDLFVGPRWESHTQPLFNRFNTQIEVAVDYDGEVIPHYGSREVPWDIIRQQMFDGGIYNGLLMKFYHPVPTAQDIQDYIREKYDSNLISKITYWTFEDQYYDQEQDKMIDITVPFVIIDFNIHPDCGPTPMKY